jgi:hypothetical protein
LRAAQAAVHQAAVVALAKFWVLQRQQPFIFQPQLSQLMSVLVVQVLLAVMVGENQA